MRATIGTENHLDATEARWFAVYTKYKREKFVCKSLQKKGIESWVPLQQFTRRYSKKVRQVSLPLIPCYAFIKITKQEYLSVLETTGVTGFVKISKNLISVPQNEIDILKRVVGEGIEISPEPGTLLRGDEVEIIGGQLTGIRGKLLGPGSQKNLLIELTGIGYHLRLHVSPSLLRKTGRPLSAASFT